MTAKAARLHLRLDAEQKALLEAASQVAGTSLSAFLLDAAASAAAEILADRRSFTLDETGWQAFDDALTRPAREISGLRELLRTPTVLDPQEVNDDV